MTLSIPAAHHVHAYLCDNCCAVHVDLKDEAGNVFATFSMIDQELEPFLAHVNKLARAATRMTPGTGTQQ